MTNERVAATHKQVIGGIWAIGYMVLWVYVCAKCPFAEWKDLPLNNANWCDNWSWGAGCIRQPWNAISNVGFLACAVVILLKLGDPAASPLFYEEASLALLLLYTCFASTLFHMSGGGIYPYGIMDVGGVIAVMWTIITLLARASRGPRRPTPFPLAALNLTVAVVFGHTFEQHPWLKWWGWDVIMIIYIALMCVFAVALLSLITAALRRARLDSNSQLAWQVVLELISAFIGLVAIVMLILSGYDGTLTHCALGNLDHGVVQLLQAYCVGVVWHLTTWSVRCGSTTTVEDM